VEQVIPRGVLAGMSGSFDEKSGFWSEAKSKRAITASALLKWREATDEVLIRGIGVELDCLTDSRSLRRESGVPCGFFPFQEALG